MKRTALVAVLVCLAVPAAAFAADEAGHRPMTYALAVAAGFSPAEAKVISDACWSQDLSQATSALVDTGKEVMNYSRWADFVARNPEYARKLLTDDAAADLNLFDYRGAMGRVGPATVVHSLMAKMPAKSGAAGESRLDEAYRAYLGQETAKLKASADPETARKVQLILVGQYLHEVVDSYVHPPNPILGHAVEGNTPDLVYFHQKEITQAATRALAVMTSLKQDVPSDGQRTAGLKLESDAAREAFARGLVEKVAAGYDPQRSRTLQPWHRFTAGEVSETELKQIGANAGEYVSHCFARQGEKRFVKIPEFERVNFTAQDKQLKVEYQGKEVAKVDNVVTWVAGNPEFKDVKGPAREALRNHVGVINAVGEAVRAAGDTVDLPPGRKVIAEKLQVGGVNLQAAMDVLDTLDVPGLRSDASLSVIDHPMLVSLTRLLEKAPEKLPIGRVHGFVFVGDDICLVGSRTDEPIELDCLAVAVKAVFKEGRAPAVSLDPKPDDLGGPQYSRVIAVPSRSAFARAMLDADYDMKRIMLGTLPAKAAARAGFHSAWDLFVEQAKKDEGAAAESASRFWLYPVALGLNDLRVSRDGTVFVFQTRVQVLTEQMALANDGLVGLGREDPSCSQAAGQFTAHYDEIAQDYPSFRKLHGLVDLVTVCSAWRRLGVRSAVLDKLAARAVAEVEVPACFAGVSRQMESGGRLLAVSGGARARARMLQDSPDARDSAQLERLRSAAALLKDVSADVDGSLKSPLPQVDRQGEFERLLGQGRRDLAARRPEQALGAFEAAAKVAPEYPDADMLRALALAMQGKGDEAVKATEAAVAKDPTDPDIADMARAVGARFADITTAGEYERRSASDSLTSAAFGLLGKGQAAQAVENFDAALKAWPENPDGLLGRGAARTVLGRHDAALKDLLQARKLFKRQGEKNRLAVALAMSAAARLGELDRQHAANELHLSSAVEELDVVADESAEAVALDAKLELAHYGHVQGRAFKTGLLAAAGQAVKWEGVQAAADDFVKLRPDSSLAYAARSTVHVFRNEYAEAAADLSKAIEINAASPVLYRQRGGAFRKAGDFDRAVADYKKALQIAPADWVHAESTRQLLKLAEDKKPAP